MPTSQPPTKTGRVKKDILNRESRAPTKAEKKHTVSSLNLQAAVSSPQHARPETILQLQRLAGNRAVSQLIQRKLVVCPSNDLHEQEADRVAGDVVSASYTPLQREDGEESLQTKSLADSITPLVQRQSEDVEEEEVQTKRLVQRQALEEEEEEEVQAKRQIQRQENDEEEVQAKSTAGGGAFSPGMDFETELNTQRGSGQPLPGDTRRFMEGRFGADFGGVRVHIGSHASQLNRAVSAQAFTQGRDIFMGEGKYNPGSEEGRRLLAHELTHVVQQGGANLPIQKADHSDTGLKKEKAITHFSKKIKARVSGARNFLGMGKKKEWKNLSAQQRSDKLLKYVNAELKKTHVPEVKEIKLKSGGDFGNATFDFRDWTIGMDDEGLEDDLTDDQIGELGDTIYHESRHCEQWFRMARLKAGEGLDKANLVSTMYIPDDIANAAVARPLKPLGKITRMLRRKQFVERQDAKLQEAKDWYASVYGDDAQHRGEVLGDIQNRYDDYRALSEEVDAWDVGGTTGQKIRALLQKS
jgi:hypothetical protein